METRSDILKYSEREADALAGRLVNKETFKDAVQVLITWLREGQCNESNAIQFRSLIQLCYDHLEKLKNEAKECLEEAQEARESSEKQNHFLKLKLSEIEEVFKVIAKKNDWSNFNENQIKEMQEMITDIMDFKDVLGGSIEIEEKDSSGMKNANNENVQSENVVEKFQTKVSHLISELNTDKKSEDPETISKECENEVLKLNSESGASSKRKENNSISTAEKKTKISDVASQCNVDQVSQKEICIMSYLSMFLYDKPDGVNMDCIYSYLNEHFPVTCTREIENLMRRFPKIFKESALIGDTQETKWTCISINPGSLSEYLNK